MVSTAPFPFICTMKAVQVFLLLLFSVSSLAQNRERLKEKTFDPSSFPAFTVELKKKKKDIPWVVNFNKATFIDCRADTSKIGFILAGSNNDYHRLVFPKPTIEYLSEKMPALYQSNPDTPTNISFAIKHLWVSERLVKTEWGRSILVGSIDYFTFCYLNMDYYTETNGQYQFLGTIDTVISARRWIVNYGDDLILKTFHEIINKANILFKKGITATTTFSKKELINNYKAAIDFPVLASPQPAKGVYLSYKEFLDNSPSVKDFIVEKTKRTETLKSAEIPDSVFNKAWAYFDGNNLNIHINNNYYRAIRVENTFELAGPRDPESKFSTGERILRLAIGNFIAGLTSTHGISLDWVTTGSHNQIMKELIPFQLNIREGTLY